MKKLLSVVFCALALVLTCGSCTEKSSGTLPPFPGGETDPDPEPDPDPDPTPFEGKARYIWIDAGGNFQDYANSQSKIAEDVKKIKETGFTDLIVDVRPTNGTVLYNTTQGTPLSKIDVWTSSGYKWVSRWASFDYLQAFIDAAHDNGLRINASINTLVGGYLCPYGLGSDGPIYSNPEMKAWASVVNTADGLVNSVDLTDYENDYGARFFSPANPDAQAYALSLIEDLARYDLDGIVLDRCRYDDHSLQSDFSDESRKQFEEYIGKTLTNWPGDVMKAGQSSFGNSLTTIQKQWLSFRVKTIHDFIVKAERKVHAVNADIRFGVYVGGWYSSYYYSGVNWASPSYDPKADGYRWADADYKNYGFADHLDFMFIGAYAGADSIYGSTEWTMQGFCRQAGDLLKGDVVYSGGPDIGNATGFEKGGQGSLMPSIVDACINSSTDGMFIFDLCHIKMYDYWDDVKNAFDKYLATLNQ